MEELIDAKNVPAQAEKQDTEKVLTLNRRDIPPAFRMHSDYLTRRAINILKAHKAQGLQDLIDKAARHEVTQDQADQVSKDFIAAHEYLASVKAPDYEHLQFIGDLSGSTGFRIISDTQQESIFPLPNGDILTQANTVFLWNREKREVTHTFNFIFKAKNPITLIPEGFIISTGYDNRTSHRPPTTSTSTIFSSSGEFRAHIKGLRPFYDPSTGYILTESYQESENDVTRFICAWNPETGNQVAEFPQQRIIKTFESGIILTQDNPSLRPTAWKFDTQKGLMVEEKLEFAIPKILCENILETPEGYWAIIRRQRSGDVVKDHIEILDPKSGNRMGEHLHTNSDEEYKNVRIDAEGNIVGLTNKSSLRVFNRKINQEIPISPQVQINTDRTRIEGNQSMRSIEITPQGKVIIATCDLSRGKDIQIYE